MNMYGVYFDEEIDNTFYYRFCGLGIGYKSMERAVALRILSVIALFDYLYGSL